MPASQATRLFHLPAIAILAAGAPLLKNGGAAVGNDYQNIEHADAQGARAARTQPNPPGGQVHDFVPLYFVQCSPMLFAINGGRVAGCPWRQADIVHFETTVQNVLGLGQPFVFYDRNATLAFGMASTDLSNLYTAAASDLLTKAP